MRIVFLLLALGSIVWAEHTDKFYKSMKDMEANGVVSMSVTYECDNEMLTKFANGMKLYFVDSKSYSQSSVPTMQCERYAQHSGENVVTMCATYEADFVSNEEISSWYFMKIKIPDILEIQKKAWRKAMDEVTNEIHNYVESNCSRGKYVFVKDEPTENLSGD